MYSHKNTSMGGMPPKRMAIKENVDPKPPAGASNSYEKVREKIDAHDDRALRNKPYTKEKMANK